MQNSHVVASAYSLILLGGALWFAAPSQAAPVKAGKPIAPHIYKVEGKTFTGTPKTVCVIQGEWSDGEVLRYETWDTCKKMTMTRGAQVDYKDVRPRGTDKRFSGKDIPEGTEVFAIGTDFSIVLVFRDRHGMQREILIRD